MIEINLLPGSQKKGKRRTGMPKLALPGPLQKLKVPSFNRAVAITALTYTVGLAGIAWLFLGARTRKADLESQIERAVLDSTRLADQMNAITTMKHRKDTIALKLNIVQEIDANRYVWAHLLDELARALPEHTWLKEVTYVLPDSADKWPKLKVEGRTGNNFALAEYMQQLEVSPFVRAVKLNSSELLREADKLVYGFILEAYYEPPTPDVIETVPLFVKSAEDPALEQPPIRRPAARPAPRRSGQE